MKLLAKISYSLLLLFFCSALSFAQTESNETNEYNDSSPKPTESNTEASDSTDEGVKLGGGGPAESLVRDGAYDKIGVKEKIALTYDHLREADIFWSKRVWRIIDVKQKMNQPFIFDHQPFIDVLFEVVDNNPDVRLFMDDAFTEEVSRGDVSYKLGSVDTVEVWDMDTEEYVKNITSNEFNAETIRKFRVKEDWIFDEESSQMVCRILGIAPVRDVIDPNTGLKRGQETMFWVYYPDLRKYLCRYETFNPLNDAIRLTWEDLLEMRLFDSYVMKESNVRDERIQDVLDGDKRLLRSKEIETEIFHREHDLWEY